MLFTVTHNTLNYISATRAHKILMGLFKYLDVGCDGKQANDVLIRQHSAGYSYIASINSIRTLDLIVKFVRSGS